jgi:ATP synthase protein I
MEEQVGRKAEQRLKARGEGDRTIWFGLGSMGVVGWSVAVPMLLGIGLGVWLDGRSGGTISWTLTLMVAGVVLGCLNAWWWIERELSENGDD